MLGPLAKNKKGGMMRCEKCNVKTGSLFIFDGPWVNVELCHECATVLDRLIEEFIAQKTDDYVCEDCGLTITADLAMSHDYKRCHKKRVSSGGTEHPSAP